MKILIVDDEESNRLFMVKMVASLGQCDLAADGFEALRAFKLAVDNGEPYDIVFLDIMMPNMDGQDVLKAIRTFEKENASMVGTLTKIFMVTALGTHENVLEAFLDGECNDFLIKPISRRMVFDKLAENGIIVDC
ncbi:MAG: response regulator [Nitrospirae bacterium]|nr:response regulator [Magnetococcales bacterium]